MAAKVGVYSHTDAVTLFRNGIHNICLINLIMPVTHGGRLTEILERQTRVVTFGCFHVSATFLIQKYANITRIEPCFETLALLAGKLNNGEKLISKFMFSIASYILVDRFHFAY